MNDEMWQAVVTNDASYDGKFYYAVKTTGIFCRPSCKSRVPSRDNVVCFPDSQAALANHFRPCKRCKPDDGSGLLPDEAWVRELAAWIDAHYAERLTLDRLAAEFHISPYHLQRTFKRIRGLSPAAYVLQARLAEAKRHLAGTDKPVTEIAGLVGMPSAAHFATGFLKMTGLTPTRYRERHRSRE